MTKLLKCLLIFALFVFFTFYVAPQLFHNKRTQPENKMSGGARFFEGDEHVKLYVEARPSVPAKLVKTITEYLKQNRPGPYGLAVDVACGSGQSTLVLAEDGSFEKVVGVDVSPGQIREANLRSDKPENVEFKESAAEVLPFEDNSVEVVYVNMAIHWFNRDLFFTEVKRILKPGGVLAISMFTNAGAESPVDVEPAVRQRFDAAQEAFNKEVRPYFDAKIDLYMENYKPIHPLPGFQNPQYLSGSDLTFQRKSTSKLQHMNLLTTSGYQLMKKSNPALAQKIDDNLKKEFEACVGDLDKVLSFEHSMILLLGSNN